MTVDVVGPVTADIFIEADHFPAGTGKEFGADTLVQTQRPVRLTVGGNAGRTAWLLARLGAGVRLHTSLGPDPLGRWLASALAAAGVQVIAAGPAATSTNCVAVDPAGRRMSFYCPGSIDYARPGPSACSELVFAAACPLPVSADLAGMLQRFRAAGAVTVIDPGPSLDRSRGQDDLALIGGFVDYLSVNAAELFELTQTPERPEAVNRVRRAGIGNLVVRLGAEGALVLAGDGTTDQIPAAELPPGIHVTIGAGDSFNAGFLYGLTQGAGPRQSAMFGTQVARSALLDPVAPALPDPPDWQSNP